MADDRRATLEAAFDAVDEGLTPTQAVEKIAAAEPVPESTAKPEKTADSKAENDVVKGTTLDVAEPKEGGPDAPTPNGPDAASASKNDGSVTIPEVEKAPASWKPAVRGKWAAVDPEVRQEILRRDREAAVVLNDTAQARQLAQGFHQMVQPYMARIQSMNAHPLVAVGELLKADHILSTAPPAQRAQFMARLISDYGVDIQALDNALVGKPVADPVDARVEQLLQQRLQPFQQFLTSQQEREQQFLRQQQEQAVTTVEQMAADTTKYPHFEAVRDLMADAVEIFSKRGVNLSLEEAYNKAVAMDPTLSQANAARIAAETQAQQAAKLNGQAQQALKASSSVRGAPTGPIGGAPKASDRRATIAAAFEAASGR